MHDLKKLCTSHLHIPIHQHYSLRCKCFDAAIQASTNLSDQTAECQGPWAFISKHTPCFGPNIRGGHPPWFDWFLVSQLPSKPPCHTNPNIHVTQHWYWRSDTICFYHKIPINLNIQFNNKHDSTACVLMMWTLDEIIPHLCILYSPKTLPARQLPGRPARPHKLLNLTKKSHTFFASCGLSPFLLEGRHRAPCSTKMACTLLKLGLNHVEIVKFTWSINTWTTKLHAVFIYQAFLAFLSQGFLHGVYTYWTSASNERNYFTPAPGVPRPGWKLWRECLGLP